MAEAKWYIVHAYSNFEKKVAQAIRDHAALKGLDDHIEELVVPTEEVVEVVRGKKKTIERRYFPGYVLMLPVPQREVDRILGTSDEPVSERPKPTIVFEVGEEVRVNEGAFQGFEGNVDEFDPESGRLKVNVSIFGRATPVDLDYTQVDKIA